MKKRTSSGVDMTGRKIGRWTVVKRGRRPRGSKSTEFWWKCRCACGEIRNKAGGDLRAGRTLSCGCATDVDWCLRTFGVSTINMPEYHIWAGILDRCTNKNDGAYARYGGRGITVCARWTPQGEKRRAVVRVHYTRSACRAAFMHFIKDMGRRPSSGHSVERKDNNKGYSKGNCVWATDVVQMNNRGNFNRRLTYRGETMTAAQWGRRLNGVVPYSTIVARKALGWSDARTLSTPVKRALGVPQIRTILARVKRGDKQVDIAADYHVCTRTIYDITVREREGRVHRGRTGRGRTGRPTRVASSAS